MIEQLLPKVVELGLSTIIEYIGYCIIVGLYCCVFVFLLLRRRRDPIEAISLHDLVRLGLLCGSSLGLYAVGEFFSSTFEDSAIATTIHTSIGIGIFVVCLMLCISHHYHAPNRGMYSILMTVLKAIAEGTQGIISLLEEVEKIRNRGTLIRENLAFRRVLKHRLRTAFRIIDQQGCEDSALLTLQKDLQAHFEDTAAYRVQRATRRQIVDVAIAQLAISQYFTTKFQDIHDIPEHYRGPILKLHCLSLMDCVRSEFERLNILSQIAEEG